MNYTGSTPNRHELKWSRNHDVTKDTKTLTKILMTGFEPFDEVKVNPSQLIVEYFAQQKITDLITAVLPVSYRKAGECIKTLIHEHQADAILMLGVAQKREQINLERIAVNIDDETIPDNEGKHFMGQYIVDDAPVGYWSTLPLQAMHDALMQAEIPVKFSNHAGAYLCNHVFYTARHTLETTNRGSIPCGFIHLPSVEMLPIETQIQAIWKCINVMFERMRIEEFEHKVTLLLQRLADQLPDKPRWIHLQDVNGVHTAHWDNVEIDTATSMAAACNALCERVLESTGNGDFRCTMIFGTEGVFLAMRLNHNQDVLSMNFEKVKSIDGLTIALNTNIAELHSVLGVKGFVLS